MEEEKQEARAQGVASALVGDRGVLRIEREKQRESLKDSFCCFSFCALLGEGNLLLAVYFTYGGIKKGTLFRKRIVYAGMAW